MCFLAFVGHYIMFSVCFSFCMLESLSMTCSIFDTALEISGAVLVPDSLCDLFFFFWKILVLYLYHQCFEV